MSQPGPRRSRLPLAGQMGLAMVAVAGVLVLVVAGWSLYRVRVTAQQQALDDLGRQVRLVSAAVERQPAALADPALLGAQLRRFLATERAVVVTATADGTLHGTGSALLPADLATPLLDGASTQERRTVDTGGRLLLAVGVPAGGGAVFIVQDGSQIRQISAPIVTALAVALVLGLLAAAGLAVLLARRLARPLVRAAATARDMAAGARDVRLPEQGAREVADVSAALNSLDAALAYSEQRQRTFLLSVSHELRTPLTAITGFGEALADGVVPPGEAAAAGAVVRDEARRLDRLVSDLLDLARLDADDLRIHLAEVDVAALAGDAARVWSARCRAEDVTFRLDVPDRPVPARTDPLRLRQIIDGLAENALRVVPAGAVVVLAVRPDDPPGYVSIAVRDSGPGLAPEDLPVAFERQVLYERYRGLRRVGTGLGLAIVAGLAGRLGGAAHAGRAPEGGASFTVRVPVGGPPGGLPVPAAGVAAGDRPRPGPGPPAPSRSPLAG